MLTTFFASIFGVLLASMPLHASDPQRSNLPMVIHIDELEQPSIDQIDLRATSHNGTALRYSARQLRAKQSVRIDVRIVGKKPIFVVLPYTKYPNLDLSTMQISFDGRTNTPKITFEFGPMRVCFSNYNGRDRVSALFKAEGAVVRVQSYADCVAQLR